VTFRGTFGHYPRLFSPETFNEWLQASKLFRRKRRYTLFADKLRVRDFVRERVGDHVLTKIHWSGSDLADAPTALPKKFVIKANNGSGTNLVVSDRDGLNWETARALTRAWMGTDNSVFGAEWQYRWIEPKIFIEEYLEGPSGDVPLDYKLFCFRGRVELMQVDLDRFGSHTRAMFDREFKRLPLTYLYPQPDGPVPKPSCHGAMIEIAESLAADEDFVRVDLYDLDRPVFGELTLHPESGRGLFDPRDWDARLLALLRRR
jgi:hypothetical protein